VVKKYGIMCGTSWEETKMAERLFKAKKAKNAAANAAVEMEVRLNYEIV